MSKQDGRETLEHMFKVMRNCELSLGARVLWALYRSWEYPTRGARVSIGKLAEYLDAGPRTVERWRAELIGARCLRRIALRGPKPAEYKTAVPASAATDVGPSPEAPTGASEQGPTPTSEQLPSTDTSSDTGVGQSTGVRELPSLSCLPKRNEARRYPTEFECVWEKYPKREGGNSKPEGYRAWRARVNEGEPPAELEAGTERYAAYCEASEIIGTRFVKQASTFFGPGEHWREDWSLSLDQSGPSQREGYASGRQVLAALETGE